MENQIFTKCEWAEISGKMNLSTQQVQIVQRIVEGYPDKKIASELGITLSTVRTHLNRLFARHSVESRQELMVLVFRKFREDCKKIGCPRIQMSK